MILLDRLRLPRKESEFDYMGVQNDGRMGYFEGSITFVDVKGGANGHPLKGRTWPLCWASNSGKQEIHRGMAARVLLAEYYKETIQGDDWNVGVVGWDPIGLLPVHMVNDPAGTFTLRVQIWRHGWMSDVFAWVLFDEIITIDPALDRRRARKP